MAYALIHSFGECDEFLQGPTKYAGFGPGIAARKVDWKDAIYGGMEGRDIEEGHLLLRGFSYQRNGLPISGRECRSRVDQCS